MNLRKMRGGKDPDDFFSIYHVTAPITSDTGKHRDGVKVTATKFEDVGILFYNHKTGHFKLFSKTYKPSNGTEFHMVKLINKLCGIGENEMMNHTLDESGWRYYYIFDGKKLWAVNKKQQSSQDVWKPYKIDIGTTASAQKVTTFAKISAGEQDVIIGDGISSCTIVKIVTDDNAKTLKLV